MKFYTLILLLLIGASCKKANTSSSSTKPDTRSEAEILKAHKWLLHSYLKISYYSTQTDTTDVGASQGLINSCLVYTLGEPNNINPNGYDWMQTDLCSSTMPNDSLFTVMGIDTTTSPTTIAWGWFAQYYQLMKLDDQDFKMRISYITSGSDSIAYYMHYKTL